MAQRATDNIDRLCHTPSCATTERYASSFAPDTEFAPMSNTTPAMKLPLGNLTPDATDAEWRIAGT